MPTDNPDVLFPVLPFATVTQPVLAVSILKAAATEAGYSAVVRYFAFDFAERVGVRSYNDVAIKWGSLPLIGDWIFAESLYGNRLPPPHRFLAYLKTTYLVPAKEVPDEGLRRLGMTLSQYFVKRVWPGMLKARKLVPEFVEQWAQEISALEPRVVGFRCASHQTCSALALARRLKMSPRPPVIIVGGPNCHRELGWQWLRCFPWIDYVCTGEGEEVFPLFLNRVLRGDAVPHIPGILSRHDQGLSVPPPVRNLDDSPVPDHSDYFHRLAGSGLASEVGRPCLPLESSRGCWWGEKCQCVFCGNTPDGIAYRSKSPRRVLAEIKRFAKEYRFGHFGCVDDALDKKHIETVFAKLGKSGSRLPFGYQVRPDLTRNELRTLYAGGVNCLVPGIESLSTAVLRLMRKGITSLANIQLLRWCAEIGIATKENWRIIYGFPGEPVSEYEGMAKLVPLLTHLGPPVSVIPMNLMRFSPYGLDPGRFGLIDVRPRPSYSFVYPFGRRKLEGIAYYFDFDYADGRQPVEYTRPLRRQVGKWMELWQTPDGSHPRLDLRTAGDGVVITDTRPCASRRTHRLRGLTAQIYQQCDAVQSLDGLLKRFRSHASDAAVKKSLKTLVANKLLIEDDGRYLSLAIMP
ncbi:MAG TPA: RiPP maturation radical SAM C-methyltransferase [Terriglobia bacterium]|nr:RiPP maturation radical SAM C-methyltransferase [Terriglobia bacterium]